MDKRDFSYRADFKCQLAKGFDPEKIYKHRGQKVTSWFVTPKLDGIRCLWFADCPDKLWTRNMKKLHGFDSIIKELKIRANACGAVFADGELMFDPNLEIIDITSPMDKIIAQSKKQKKVSIDTDFNTTQSIVMKKTYSEEKEKVRLHVFYVFIPDKNLTLGKDSRDDMILFDKVKLINAPRVIPIVAAKLSATNISSAIERLAYEKEGYEGVILRSTLCDYHFGRSENLLKIKSFKEVDLPILELFEGKGKYNRTLGGLSFKLNNRTFSVGSGFTDSQRDLFWAQGLNMLNKIATIKYQDLSAYGIPRFPIFVGIKEDR